MDMGTGEFGGIGRDIYIDAPREIVFDVITNPEHIREWWNEAETDVTPSAGAVSEVSWKKGTSEQHIEELTVVDAQPPTLFSFRWVYGGETPTPTNSLLVTFELEATGTGTTVHLTETGFRERGWEAATLEATYNDHVNGWDTFLPALGAYVARLVSSR